MNHQNPPMHFPSDVLRPSSRMFIMHVEFMECHYYAITIREETESKLTVFICLN